MIRDLAGGLVALAFAATVAAAPCKLGAQGLPQPVNIAKPRVELALSHWLPADHPLVTHGFIPWARSIERASGGRLEVMLYPAQQLGRAAEHYDMAREGSADIVFINQGYSPGRFPLLSLTEMPMLVSDAVAGSKAIQQWYADYAVQEMEGVYPCLLFQHDPGTLHATSGPLTAPADLKGRSVRPANGTMVQLIRDLGGEAVLAPATEMRALLEQGEVEVIAAPWDSLVTFGLDRTLTHHLDMPFYSSTFAILMNAERIAGLAPEDRAVIARHCTPDAAERMAAGWVEEEQKGRAVLDGRPGHVTYRPSPAEIAAWKAATAPLMEGWRVNVANQTGVDPDLALAALERRLEAAGALYE
ncbi:TRAP transporter substrate-binding protein [Pseudooceanicola nanhaiensis]|uniref:TRAP transporter substrate-binding protein n=1 Tax=Pseudooceanicola nanhaiensis TaxID=375761 RepID=UPI001CD41AE8|nr:TRAP transporter substrate-binding protein [Pseudooceanicola nanhaiensis]MCA0918817.1 TRAP transporter substrate-binding protein [Pseudooceanicola nanhaiensis]